MKKAILFIVFNRIETAEQVFKSIRSVKPSRLYIAADGPREGKQGEVEKCNNVRNIAQKVDWECEVKTLFQEKNLGCKLGVVTAINWFFENEEEGIILEDDIVPKSEFYGFCEICLEQYRNNFKIFAILGFNQFGQGTSSNSYFFSRGYYPWGWATWKSRWNNYSPQIDKQDIRKLYLNKNYPPYALAGIAFNLKLVIEKLLDTWDYQIVYHMIVTDSYTIVPFANLTTNIGKDGAHSSNNTNIFHEYGNMDIQFLEHPKNVEDNSIMNQKLWKEFKEAYPLVIFKGLLLKLGIYRICRNLIKSI